jgi:hypothetical protein
MDRREFMTAVAGGRRPREVRLYSPDEETARGLDWKARGSEVSFLVPEVKTYAVIAISW